MADFAYQDPFPLEKDDTSYRHLTPDYVSVAEFDGVEVLKVDPEGLTHLAREAMREQERIVEEALGLRGG